MRLLISVLILILALVVGVWSLKRKELYTQSLSWPSTIGYITSISKSDSYTRSKNTNTKRYTYMMEICYGFTVDSTFYASHDVTLYGKLKTEDKHYRDTYFYNHQDDDTVTVSFNPHNPEQSYLISDRGNAFFNLRVFSFFLVFIGFILFWGGLEDLGFIGKRRKRAFIMKRA